MMRLTAIACVAALFAMAGCEAEPEGGARPAPGRACSGFAAAPGCTASVDRPCLEAGGSLVRIRESGRGVDATYCRIDGVWVDGYSWFRAVARKERSSMSDFFTAPAPADSTCASLGGSELSASNEAGVSVALCRFADESTLDLETIKAGASSPGAQRVASLLARP